MTDAALAGTPCTVAVVGSTAIVVVMAAAVGDSGGGGGQAGPLCYGAAY